MTIWIVLDHARVNDDLTINNRRGLFCPTSQVFKSSPFWDLVNLIVDSLLFFVFFLFFETCVCVWCTAVTFKKKLTRITGEIKQKGSKGNHSDANSKKKLKKKSCNRYWCSSWQLTCCHYFILLCFWLSKICHAYVQREVSPRSRLASTYNSDAFITF